jgi:hypothetical protein
MLLILPLAHQVIIVHAATDNLTELVRDGGAGVACAGIALWALLLAAQGSAAAARRPGLRSFVGCLSVIAVGLPVGFAILSVSTEPMLEKYGATFSGLQFILSMDRDHYATGGALFLRYCVLHVSLVFALWVAQAPLWAAKLPHFKRGIPDVPTR